MLPIFFGDAAIPMGGVAASTTTAFGKKRSTATVAHLYALRLPSFDAFGMSRSWITAPLSSHLLCDAYVSHVVQKKHLSLSKTQRNKDDKVHKELTREIRKDGARQAAAR